MTLRSRICLFLALSFVSPIPSIAQYWEFKNPLPSSNNLRLIEMLNDDVAVVLGEGGSVLITTDGGASWSSNSYESQETPYKLILTDVKTWWIVGTAGLIAKTTDSGTSWKIVMHNIELPVLYDAYFPDPDNGLVLGEYTMVWGNTVSLVPIQMRTTDGGMTWSKTTLNQPGLISVSFVDRNHGWGASARGGVFRTTDAGSTWERAPGPANSQLNRIQFFDLRRGVCWGNQWNEFRTKLFVTSDSGKTWNALLDTALYTSSAVFANEHDFWMSSAYDIRHTTDAGKTWVTGFLSYDDNIHGLAVGTSNVLAVGDVGRIWQSTNGGAAWIPRFSGARNILRGIALTDSAYWAVGGGTAWFNHPLGTVLLRSTDSGEHWESQPTPTSEYLYSVSFVDSRTGWIGGEHGVISKTTDAGVTWVSQTSGDPGAIRQIQFLDSHHGWAVTSVGSLLHTDDGGAEWQEETADVIPAALDDIFMIDSMHGVAVGESGALLKTGNGGQTWHSVDYHASLKLRSVVFVDSGRGFVAASDGHLLRTTDGGSSWSVLDLGTHRSFYAIAFLTPDTGFAAGEFGELAMTVDSGNTWQLRNSGTTSRLLRAKAGSSTGAWIVGDNGNILRFGQPTWTTISSVRPSARQSRQIDLFQSFPNPFNSTTTIRYRLPTTADVSLVVFDILGQIVATVHKGVQSPGYHNHHLDCSYLSSGAYFVQLRAGETIQTLKLLLIR